MNIQIQYFLIETIASSPDDQLIDWRTENILKISVFVFIIAVASAINIISRKVEHAIVFALTCTIISLAFFLIK